MTQPTTTRRTLTIAGLGVLVTFLDTTVLFVAFPDISRHFSSAGPAALSWVLNAYTITFAALLVPAGKVADRVGHKSVFLAGMALFTAASAACALAPTVEVLVAFRVVQAVGAAALIPASMALVLRSSPPERVAANIAVWGAMGALAGALGPTIGASLIELADWRLVFVINLPIGIAVVVVGARSLVESKDPSIDLPAPGGVLAIAGAAALVSLAIVQVHTWGAIDVRTIVAATAGLALFAVFIAHQRRTSSPAVDLSLFAIRNYTWANAATFAFGLAFTAMFFGSYLLLTDLWGYSVLKAGLGLSPGPALVAVLAPRLGRLAGRIGQRELLVAGGAVFALGGTWRAVAVQVEPDYLVAYLPALVLTGLGVALCFPQLASTTAQALPPSRLGVGGAVNQAVRQFGGTIGVAITIAILAAATPGDPVSQLRAFDLVAVVSVVGGILTSLLVLPLRTRRIEPAADLAVDDDVHLIPETGART